MLNKTTRKLFIGSSNEALPIALELKKIIQVKFKDSLEVKVWKETKWKSLVSVLDNLSNNLDEFYYAIFICHPDDIVHARNKMFYTSRDNVLFEFGLFFSRLGKDRAFLLLPGHLNYDSQIPLAIQALDSTKEISFKLLTDIGESLITYRIDLNYKLAKAKSNSGKYERYDLWKPAHLKRDVNPLLSVISEEEKKYNSKKPLLETELISKGQNIVNAIKVSDDKPDQFFINKLSNELQSLIYTRSIVSEKSVSDTTIDIVGLICKFKDFLDIEQLVKAQHFSKIKEVWVFADSPIEFSQQTDKRKKKLLLKTILCNLEKRVKYTYIVNQHFDVATIDDLFKGLSKAKQKVLKNRITIIKVDSKYFKTFFTIHFLKDNPSTPGNIYMSALLPDRDDLLIQIAQKIHFNRIFERIKKLVGYRHPHGPYNVRDHVVRDVQ